MGGAPKNLDGLAEAELRAMNDGRRGRPLGRDSGRAALLRPARARRKTAYVHQAAKK